MATNKFLTCVKRSLKVLHICRSNTSTVTLRVVGGDEKGSLNSETVLGLGPEKDYDGGEGQQHIKNIDPSSRQIGRPTKTRLQLSKNNKYDGGSTPRFTD
jgi:hypothetical protein